MRHDEDCNNNNNSSNNNIASCFWSRRVYDTAGFYFRLLYLYLYIYIFFFF